MHRTKEERRARHPRGNRRGGVSAKLAAVGLIAVVVAVGAVGFFAVSAIHGATSHTVKTCTPSSAPVCQAQSGVSPSVMSVAHSTADG